jgi:single-strand DNA-binding protein
MALHTQQSLSGFIASEPQQSVTENGDTRFYVRVGQPHFRREDGGGFTELDPSFHDLVTYRATADRALDRFAKGDSFVAEGYVRTFQVERDGEVVEREEFVAKKIGHDLARTNYEVDRARRAPAAEREAPAVGKGISQDAGPARVDTGALAM